MNAMTKIKLLEENCLKHPPEDLNDLHWWGKTVEAFGRISKEAGYDKETVKACASGLDRIERTLKGEKNGRRI